MTDDERTNLITELQAKIAAWVRANAARIRDDQCIAKIEITLSSPQYDDDDTLLLDYSIDETVTSCGGEACRVEGIRCSDVRRAARCLT